MTCLRSPMSQEAFSPCSRPCGAHGRCRPAVSFGGGVRAVTYRQLESCLMTEVCWLPAPAPNARWPALQTRAPSGIECPVSADICLVCDSAVQSPTPIAIPALPLFLCGLAGIGVVGRRRKKLVAQDSRCDKPTALAKWRGFCLWLPGCLLLGEAKVSSWPNQRADLRKGRRSVFLAACCHPGSRDRPRILIVR